MAHHHHRQVAAKHLGHLPRIISGRIHHDLAADLALGRLHHPFIAFPPHPRRRAEPLDPRPHLARPLGQRLRQLRRVDIAIVRVIQRPGQIMRLDERVARPDLVGRQDIKVHPLIPPHPHHALELLQPLLAVPQPHRPGHMVIHRVIHGLAQTAIQLRRIALHVHDRPAAGECRHVPSRMPCAASSQFVLLQKDAIRPSRLGEVIERRRPHRAPANDHHPRARGKIRHHILRSCRAAG